MFSDLTSILNCTAQISSQFVLCLRQLNTILSNVYTPVECAIRKAAKINEKLRKKENECLKFLISFFVY